MEGQIIKILSNLYTVSKDNNLYPCHVSGKFRYNNLTPTVGDYVKFDQENLYITEIIKRKNILDRPKVANIDQVIVVTSTKEPDLDLNLLDKLLVCLFINDIKPIICFTKLDLLNRSEYLNVNNIRKYYSNIGYTVLDNTETDKIKKLLKNKTTALTGQTGSGKSSLLNRLNIDLNLEVGAISKKLGRGKHTTRHVELINIYGGKVLDTPGFSAIDISKYRKTDIKNSFIEFNNYSCKYQDCMHIKEDNCLIKELVNNKVILESRYINYTKFIGGLK